VKRIVIDAREYPTSTGRYIRKLLEYLEKIDGGSHEREYLVLLKSADLVAYQPKAKNFKKVAADFKEFTFAEQFGLLRLIRNLKPDLVHYGKDHQPLLYFGKTVTTMHDLTTLRFTNPNKNLIYFKAKQFVYFFVVLAAAWKTNHIITATEFVKTDLTNFTKVKPSKITVTPEAADKITVPAIEVKKLKNVPYIMYVGRSLPHKNLRRLIDAFGIIKPTHSTLKLVLVGKKDHAMNQLISYAKEKNLPDVIATGYVEEGELRWLYENTACYCFPSLSEGFGLPSLEAMIHGAPVASSNTTCLPEVNGDAAQYFNPEDTHEMAAKITEILEDDTLRAALIKKGYKQAAKYSWQRMAEQTFSVYKKVL
jgi:glycosyltransferase involved in cell wall biosynthesis